MPFFSTEKEEDIAKIKQANLIAVLVEGFSQKSFEQNGETACPMLDYLVFLKVHN